MNKKALIFTSVVSLAAIGFVTAFATKQQLVKRANAEECEHSVVEHYEASETSIEHWACCSCHHAWADAAKTMEISSNTTSDRSKIDFGSKQYTIAINYSNDDWDWGKNCTVIHDEKYDFAYSTSDTNMKQAFIGSINEYMDPLEEGKYYFFEITNNTDKELNATPVDRGWGSSSDSVVIPIGESKIVSAPWTTWNANATKKGPCVRLDSTAGENFAGNITFSTLQILNENPGYYSKVALVPSWDYLDANVSYVGGTFAINTSLAFTEASSEVFFESKDTTTELANGKYYMVQVTNDTNAVLAVKMVGREWGGTAGDTFTVSIGETAIVYASSTTWNSQTKKGVAVRFAPSAGGTFYGTLTVSNPVIVDAIPAPTLFNRLDAQDSDWHSVPVNLTYDNQYGYCYSFNGANVAHLYLRTVVELNPANYSQVHFHLFNGGTGTGDFAAWSEDWNNHGNGFGTLVANSWILGHINVDTWNGDRSSCDVGFYDFNFNGLVKLTFGELVAL